MGETLCNTAPTHLMTLDEAIQHCIEKGGTCTQCAKEHLQLAEWLKELKFLREQYRKWYAPIPYKQEPDRFLAVVDLAKIDEKDITVAGTFCRDAIKD